MTVTLASCSHQPGDDDIKSNVTKQLQSNPDLKSINVAVDKGVVTLSGTCTTQGCDSAAEKQIKGVDGIKSIDNEIKKNVDTDLTLRTSVQDIVSKYDGVSGRRSCGGGCFKRKHR